MSKKETESRIILSMQGIDKRFMGVHALKNVDLELKSGEIHALVGENGAGKSTLIKILTGIYEKDSGEIFYNTRPFHATSPRQAMDVGISIIHQELNLMDQLTVSQNVFIGRESMKPGGLFLNEKKQNQRTANLFKRFNMNIRPTDRLGDLTVGKQQMVEIAKAISYELKILVLDEPTAALTETEANELFAIMKNLSTRGVGMIYISHRMDEIDRIADRVTVLRDGKHIGTYKNSEISRNNIISMMVGRVIHENQKQKSNVKAGAPEVLRVENLNAGRLVKDVSLSLKKGEILGFAGLMGAGRTETARAIFGADEIRSGRIFVHGEEVHIQNPMDAVRLGLGYLSEDRKRFGLATGLSVTENALMASYNMFSKGIFINFPETRKITEEYVESLKIKTPKIEQILRNLSGGNQQKVVIAKWLIRNSDILIFDEPTRGIDVGAKNEIYILMNNLVKQGKSIIMISSELPEILHMSDRVVVMCEGRVTANLDIQETSQEKIIRYATLGAEI